MNFELHRSTQESAECGGALYWQSTIHAKPAVRVPPKVSMQGCIPSLVSIFLAHFSSGRGVVAQLCAADGVQREVPARCSRYSPVLILLLDTFSNIPINRAFHSIVSSESLPKSRTSTRSTPSSPLFQDAANAKILSFAAFKAEKAAVETKLFTRCPVTKMTDWMPNRSRASCTVSYKVALVTSPGGIQPPCGGRNTRTSKVLRLGTTCRVLVLLLLLTAAPPGAKVAVRFKSQSTCSGHHPPLYIRRLGVHGGNGMPRPCSKSIPVSLDPATRPPPPPRPTVTS